MQMTFTPGLSQAGSSPLIGVAQGIPYLLAAIFAKEAGRLQNQKQLFNCRPTGPVGWPPSTWPASSALLGGMPTMTAVPQPIWVHSTACFQSRPSRRIRQLKGFTPTPQKELSRLRMNTAG